MNFIRAIAAIIATGVLFAAPLAGESAESAPGKTVQVTFHNNNAKYNMNVTVYQPSPEKTIKWGVIHGSRGNVFVADSGMPIRYNIATKYAHASYSLSNYGGRVDVFMDVKGEKDAPDVPTVNGAKNSYLGG
jgi:hypothetical protein